MYMWNYFALEPLISIYNSNNSSNIKSNNDSISNSNISSSNNDSNSNSNSNSNNDSNSNCNSNNNSNSNDISCWIVPIIHGFFKQRIMRLIDDHTLGYTLIARRSRY